MADYYKHAFETASELHEELAAIDAMIKSGQGHDILAQSNAITDSCNRRLLMLELNSEELHASARAVYRMKQQAAKAVTLMLDSIKAFEHFNSAVVPMPTIPTIPIIGQTAPTPLTVSHPDPVASEDDEHLYPEIIDDRA